MDDKIPSSSSRGGGLPPMPTRGARAAARGGSQRRTPAIMTSSSPGFPGRTTTALASSPTPIHAAAATSSLQSTPTLPTNPTKEDVQVPPLEEVRPEIFLKPKRANVINLVKTRTNLSYQWKPKNGDLPELSKQEMAQAKERLDWELRKHVFAFQSPACAGWIIKKTCKNVDTSSSVFRALREYIYCDYRNIKHEVLFERLYASIIIIAINGSLLTDT